MDHRRCDINFSHPDVLPCVLCVCFDLGISWKVSRKNAVIWYSTKQAISCSAGGTCSPVGSFTVPEKRGLDVREWVTVVEEVLDVVE